jgi:hypothetical protein
MSKGKRARPKANAWLFALGIPLVALFVLFSLLPYDRMVEQWPLGIGKEEVMAYQFVFDHRPGQHVQGKVGKLFLEPYPEGRMGVTLDGEHDTATVVTGPSGAIFLTFPEERPFQGLIGISLVPADIHSLQAKYAQLVADSLGMLGPRLSVVEVVRSGKALGPFLQEARITPEFLLRRAPVSTSLLRANGAIPKDKATSGLPMDTLNALGGRTWTGADRFDTSSTAALGLLASAEQRHDLLRGSAGAMYDQVTGRITPLYGLAATADSTASAEVAVISYEDALSTEAAQGRMVRMASRLREDSAEWEARFLAVDSAWVPVLAKGRNIGLVQAEVDRVRNTFMQRLFHPDPAAFIGRPVPGKAASSIPLDPWLAKYRSQPDTLRFVRGKYDIDHDLVIPHGIALVLERGARWNIAPGVSVVVNGELHIRGTGLNPVFIRPQDAARPYGAIAVHGDGDTRVRISGLQMSGGSGLWYDGVAYRGMLAFHSTDVRMEHCHIGAALGKNAVVIKRGQAVLRDDQFTDAAQDLVHLAEVRGQVERCSFAQAAGGGTADRSGLMLRGCHVLIKECTFNGLPFTALRIARHSEAMALHSTFSGNSTAIRATDGSHADVDGCTFTANKLVYALSEDRPVLGGASMTTHANIMSANAALREMDAASRTDSTGVIDPARRRAFGLAN